MSGLATTAPARGATARELVGFALVASGLALIRSADRRRSQTRDATGAAGPVSPHGADLRRPPPRIDLVDHCRYEVPYGPYQRFLR